MIHMLSRFDLRVGVDISAFAAAYARLADRMATKDLLVGSTPVGRREADTPMDTDVQDAPEYYSIMTFRDREQLDRAYGYLLRPPEDAEDAGDERAAHETVKRGCRTPTFTCWRDLRQTQSGAPPAREGVERPGGLC